MTEDQDPTGVRHLLSGMRETGPMPDDLAERIRASLADEQALRESTPARTDTAESTTENTAGNTAENAAEDGAAFWSEMDEPQASGRRNGRRRYAAAPWVLGAAAAAVVALGVGGLVLERGLGGGDSSADGAANEPTTASQAEQGEDSDAAESSDTSTAGSAPSDVPAFAITASGTDYSQETAADAAGQLLADPTSVPSNDNTQALGTLTTAAGARDCLARLGQPQMDAVVVDVATFDGRDGLLLIAQSLPDGPARAWAVTEGCEPIWPESVDVPTD